MPEDTPMFKQYSEVKAKLAPNTLLLFRLGDFFEMFDGFIKQYRQVDLFGMDELIVFNLRDQQKSLVKF